MPPECPPFEFAGISGGIARNQLLVFAMTCTELHGTEMGRRTFDSR